MSVESGPEFGTVVGEHPGDVNAKATQFADRQVDEAGCDVGVGRAEEHVADRVAGRGVDRGELPDLPDSFEVPDVEAVQGDQVTGPGREMAEPERALSSVVGDQTSGRCGQLRERTDALTTPAEAVTAQDLLHATRRDHKPAFTNPSA